MLSFVQSGDVLDLDPGATVPAGTGHLFGSVFGVAAVDAVSGTASPFVMDGVVDIAKTSALAISIGDLLFWDATNSVVNKTAAAQLQVGIAIADAANPSATVRMLMRGAAAAAASYIASISTDTTLSAAHHTVLVDATAGNVVITLPTAASAFSGGIGRVYNVKKVDASANTVTVDGSGAETIDGAATQVLTDQYQSMTIQSNGTSWGVL